MIITPELGREGGKGERIGTNERERERKRYNESKK